MGCFSGPNIEMQSTMDPTVRERIFNPMTALLQGQLFDNGGAFSVGATPDWAYSGQRVAPLTGLQSDVFGTAGAQGLQSTRDLLSGAWTSPITSQVKNLWNQTIMPSIMNQQGMMDSAGSGGTTERLTRAGQDLYTDLAGQLAPLSLQASQIGTSNLGSLAGLGAMQQQQAQNQLAANQQYWMESQPWSHPGLGYLGQAAGMGNMTPVQQAPGMGYSLIGGMVPALSMAATGGLAGFLTPAMSFGQGAGMALTGGRW